MLILILLFIQQFNTITELESIYTHSYDFTLDSLKSIEHYDAHPNYNDIKNLYLRNVNYNYKNKTFQLYFNFKLAFNRYRKAECDKAIESIKRNYFKSDKEFILNYLNLLFKIKFENYFDLNEINNFCDTYLDKNIQSFKIPIYYSLLVSLKKQRRFDDDYLILLTKFYDLRKDVRQEKIFDLLLHDHMLFYRAYGLYDIYEIFLRKFLQRMEGRKKANPGYYNVVIRKYMEYYYRDRNFITKNFKLDSLIVEDVLLKSERQLIELYKDNEINISDIESNDVKFTYYKREYFRNIKNNTLRSYALDSLVIYTNRNVAFPYRVQSAALEDNLAQADSIYLAYRNSHLLTLFKNKYKSTLTHRDVFIGKILTDYFYYKAQKDPTFVINEYFDLATNRDVKKHPLFSEAYKKIENETSFDGFYMLNQQYLDAKESSLTHKNSFNLNRNENLIVVFKGYSKSFIISKKGFGEYKFTEMGNIATLLDKDKTYIVIDNHNMLSIEEEHYNIFKKIPEVRYVTNISQLSDIKKRAVNTIGFYGTDAEFKYKKELYLPLISASKDLNSVSQTQINNQFNKKVLKKFNESISHFSGHFIESDIHSIYNKIALYTDKKSVSFLNGYDITEHNFSSDIVILNACRSNKSTTWDDLSGQQNFPKFLIDAGVKTVVTTHVPIEDKFSSVFIQKFYEYAFELRNLSKALSETKNFFISKNTKFEQINAFRIYGYDTEIELEKSLFAKMSSIIFILIALFFFIKMFKNRLRIIKID